MSRIRSNRYFRLFRACLLLSLGLYLLVVINNAFENALKISDMLTRTVILIILFPFLAVSVFAIIILFPELGEFVFHMLNIEESPPSLASDLRLLIRKRRKKEFKE